MHLHVCAKVPHLGLEPVTLTPVTHTVTQLTKCSHFAIFGILHSPFPHCPTRRRNAENGINVDNGPFQNSGNEKWWMQIWQKMSNIPKWKSSRKCQKWKMKMPKMMALSAFPFRTIGIFVMIFIFGILHFGILHFRISHSPGSGNVIGSAFLAIPPIARRSERWKMGNWDSPLPGVSSEWECGILQLSRFQKPRRMGEFQHGEFAISNSPKSQEVAKWKMETPVISFSGVAEAGKWRNGVLLFPHFPEPQEMAKWKHRVNLGIL